MVLEKRLHRINEAGATRNQHEASRMRLMNHYPVGRRSYDVASFFAGSVVATGGCAWLPIEVSY
jgi:hypothetical protein